MQNRIRKRNKRQAARLSVQSRENKMNEIIFEIAVVKGEIIIENFNSRFNFERNQDGVYQKIFGKYVLDEDVQIRVIDRTTAEEYLVDYALKG